MAIYLDLHPAPQFDKSIVTYCVVNFGRIRDALQLMSKRVAYESYSIPGPWPASVGVTVPFPKADVQIWAEVTYWSNAVAFIAMGLTWDGVTQGPLLEQYFNETGSHKAMDTTIVVRNVSGGVHTLGIVAVTGGVLSDGTDRLRQHYTYYEL